MADRALTYGTFGRAKRNRFRIVSMNVLKEEHAEKVVERVTGEEMRMREQNTSKMDALRARMPWWTM